MPTPTRHCQTRTIEQVGMNQAAAADKVDHFSPFIIHVSLMLLGKIGKKKREKDGETEEIIQKAQSQSELQ